MTHINNCREAVDIGRDMVDNFIRINYIETVTPMSKELLRDRLITNMKTVLCVSPLQQFPNNLELYLQGFVTPCLEMRAQPLFGYELLQEVANEVATIESNIKHQSTPPAELIDEISALGVSYGIRLFPLEADTIAQLLTKHGVDDSAKRRTWFISNYVANCNISIVNDIMSQLAEVVKAENVFDIRRLARRMSNDEVVFELTTESIRRAMNKLREYDAFYSVMLKRHSTGDIEVTYQRLREITIELMNMDIQPLPDSMFMDDAIWAKYQDIYTKQGFLKVPDMTERRSVIERQTTAIIQASALDVSSAAITKFVNHVLECGVTCARGVELMVRACWGKVSPYEQYTLQVEAMLWELTSRPGTVTNHILLNILADRASTVKFVSDVIKWADQHQVSLFSNIERVNSVVEVLLSSRITSELHEPGHSHKLAPLRQLGDVEVGSVGRTLSVAEVNALLVKDDNVWDEYPIGNGGETIRTYITKDTHFHEFDDGEQWFIINREYGPHPENGYPMLGMWVMRNVHTGEYIDSDRMYVVLCGRQNIKS